MLNRIKSAFILILQPIYPMRTQRSTPHFGHVTSIITLSHALAGSVVIFGVFSAEKGLNEKYFLVKWVLLTIFATLGALSVLILIISSCRRALKTRLENTGEEPSINLIVVFLWIFGLANMIQMSLNIVVYMECITKPVEDDARFIFLIFANTVNLLFTTLQLVFLTYNKRAHLRFTSYLHFAVIIILAANFTIWYSSSIHSLFIHGDTTGHGNKSCFHTSDTYRGLVKEMSVILLPPEMEFFILSSTLTIYLWQNALEYQTVRHAQTYTVLTGDNYEGLPNTISRDMGGTHILALILGLSVNFPVFISTVLLDFVYDWKTKHLITVLDGSEILSGICTCVVVSVSSHRMKNDLKYTTKPLVMKEYILIISSAGIMAYLAIGFLASLSNNTHQTSSIVSHLFQMVVVFLQTLFLIRSTRYTTGERRTGFTSIAPLFLVTTNLVYWLLDSYNRNFISRSRFGDYANWKFVRIFLVPLTVYYRFFSGMSAYSMNKRFQQQ